MQIEPAAGAQRQEAMPLPEGPGSALAGRCAALAAVMRDPVIVTGPGGMVVWLNPAGSALVGPEALGAEAIEGAGPRPSAVLARWDADPEALAALDRATRAAQPVTVRLSEGAKPNGGAAAVVWSVAVHPQQAADGTAEGCLVVLTPVADDPGGALETVRSMLFVAIESLPDGFVLLDDRERLVMCNAPYRALMAPVADLLVPGTPFRDILRAAVAQGMVPEAEGREAAWLEETLPPLPPEGAEQQVALADGRWLRIVERPTPDGGRVGLRIDITQQVESRRRAEIAEAEARRLRAQLQNAIEALPDGFILFDEDDRLVTTNRRMREVFPAIASAYVPGAHFADLLRRALKAGLLAEVADPDAWVAERLAERRLPQVTRTQALADGRVLQMIDQAIPDGGRVGLRIDITELVQARRELADMIAGAAAGTFRADLRSGALSVNDRWASILGHDCQSLGGMDLDRLRALAHRQDRRRLDRSLLAAPRVAARRAVPPTRSVGTDSSEDLSLELRLRHRSGRDVWVLMGARVTARDAAGQAEQVSGLMLDITGRRRREAILQAVASAAERLLGGGDWLAERDRMLAAIGFAADVDRSYFFALDPPVDPSDPAAVWNSRQEAEWCREGITPQIDNAGVDVQDMVAAGLGRHVEAFRRGQPFVMQSRDEMTERERPILEPQGIEALSLYPVMSGQRVAGFLGFDRCRPDPSGWTADAIDALTAAAHISGAALETAATQRRLREARDRAEAASRSKSDFLAIMSHEIRTPLNGVLGVAELLASAVTDPEHHRMLGIIRHSGETLLGLLNDLLDLSRIEAGRLPLEAAPFLPRTVARRLEDVHGLAAREKGLAFIADLGPGCGEARLGDARRVQQILHNLLGNAVKFTEVGQVRLEMAAPPGGPLVMRVRDTGIGMSDAQRARVFDTFTQADSSISRRYGGSGLGMAIVHELVEMMAGQIVVESALGQGTTVTVTLPLRSLGTRAQSDPEPVEPDVQRDLSGLRVLAADDNAANRFLLGSILKRLGMQPQIVSDGAAAVAAARAGRFDVILLDISMPGTDGPAALRAVRAEAAARGRTMPPVVAVTANAMPDQVADYLAQGFAAHVPKPFALADLRAALVAVLAQPE
ncbi:MAG: PAS-domain containing protein [Alkalilacustris sp.]